MRVRDPLDPVAYARACETGVPIELESLSYHSCPFVRSRAAAKTKRLHVIERLLHDPDPGVVANAVDNPACSRALIKSVSSNLLVHSHENWQVVWEALIRHKCTPTSMRTLFVHKERERRRKMRKDLKMLMLPELEPPKAAPISKTGQRRFDLNMLRPGSKDKKGIPRDAVMVPAGLAYFVTHPSTLVQKAFKKYKRRIAYYKKKKKHKNK